LNALTIKQGYEMSLYPQVEDIGNDWTYITAVSSYSSEDVTSYSLVEKFIQIVVAHLPDYKSQYIKLNVSISRMECYVVKILAPFWSPYTAIHCKISTWSAAFCTHSCNLEDTDSALFLYKSRGMMAEVSWICCSRSSSVFGLDWQT